MADEDKKTLGAVINYPGASQKPEDEKEGLLAAMKRRALNLLGIGEGGKAVQASPSGRPSGSPDKR